MVRAHVGPLKALLQSGAFLDSTRGEPLWDHFLKVVLLHVCPVFTFYTQSIGDDHAHVKQQIGNYILCI